MGMTDYLAKPIDRRLLLNRIAETTCRRASPVESETLRVNTLADFDLSDVLSAIDANAA
jgi:DNA-binding response OmpR family regulator